MSQLVFVYIVAFIFGINIGSFLNVVIWRLPRGGSVSTPTWSYCPRCEHRLGALDLVPVFSFIALGRKCRYCHNRISWRYPAIELLTGLLFLAVAWRFGVSYHTIFYCLFTAVMVAVFFIDLEHFIIPDELNVIAILIGFVHNGVNIYLKAPNQFVNIKGFQMPASLAGLIIYSAVIYFIGFISYVLIVSIIERHKGFFKAAWEYIYENVLDWVFVIAYCLSYFIKPLRKYISSEPLEGVTAEEIIEDKDSGGMGAGDGKLAAAIGANLFVALALQSFILAIFIGGFIGIFIMIKQRKKFGSRTPMPFGPPMVIGALLSLFFGPSLVNLWLMYVNFVRGSIPGPAPTGVPGNNTGGLPNS